jgi:hypothetical protein
MVMAMAVDRRARCPSCARLIRVTEDELVEKRGFCAVCDARFDITPERLEGATPHRENALVPVRPVPPSLPSGRLVVTREANGEAQLVVRGSKLPGLLTAPVSALLCWKLIDGLYWYGLSPMDLLLIPVVALAVGLPLWSLFGRERLRVHAGGLTWTRELLGVRLARREAAGSATLTVEHPGEVGGLASGPATYLRVRADGQLALEVGHGLLLGASDAAWARGWLSATLSSRALPPADGPPA